jgi:hypothetical protein
MARLAELAEWSRPAAESLTRAAALSRGPQRAQLERRAAALYTQLGEQAMSCAALRRALMAHPGDELAFTQLHAQLAAPNEREQLLNDFLDTLFYALSREPNEPDLLRTLVRTGHTGHRPLLEQVGLFALEALSQATREELAAAERLRAGLPERFTIAGAEMRARARLDDASFTKLLPRELSPDLLALGQAVSAAYLEISPDQVEVRRPTRITPRENHPLRGTLSAALEAFGLTLGTLYGSDSDSHAFYPLRLVGSTQSWVVGRELIAPRMALLKAAPLIAAGRAQLLGIVGGSAALTLTAGVANSNDDPVGDVRRKITLMLAAVGLLDEPGLRRETETLALKLSRPSRAAVTAAWEKLTLKVDAPQRLAQSLANLGRRASLVVTGDVVSVAMQLTDANKSSLRAACVTPAGLELLRFWVAPACTQLLETLGVNA